MGVGATVLTPPLAVKTGMDIDATLTGLLERKDVHPWISYHSDPAKAKGFYASFSGAGLPIADFMSRMIGADVSKYGLCSFAVNDGSRIRVPEVAARLIERARELRPDIQKPKFVFHGISFGGIEAQLVANYIFEHYNDAAEVVGIMYESTPSGPDAVGSATDLGKRLFAQYMVRTGQPVGRATIYAANIWGIMIDQARKDPAVWHDITSNANATYPSIIPDQDRLIDDRFPQLATISMPDGKVAWEDSEKWYVGSADGSDPIVDVARSVEDIDRTIGGGLRVIDVPGAGHASGWTKELYAKYLVDAYEIALKSLVARLS